MATLSMPPQSVRRPAAEPVEPVEEPHVEPSAIPVAKLDPDEVADWLESLDDLLLREGPEAVRQLLTQLYSRAQSQSVPVVPAITTPYVNTIAVENQPAYPGDQEIERRLRAMVRWNAMAMVQQAYHSGTGVGGHIAIWAGI